MAQLDRVFVSTSRQTIELSWYSRDLLLAELRHRDSATAIVAAFDQAVDPARPVRLGRADEAVLDEVIQEWSRRLSGELPVGVWDLRNALADYQ